LEHWRDEHSIDSADLHASYKTKIETLEKEVERLREKVNSSK